MAKFRINHARNGKGGSKAIGRMAMLLFFVFLVVFLVIGKKSLKTGLEHSALFAEIDNPIFIDTLNNIFPYNFQTAYYGKVDSTREKSFLIIPGCDFLKTDSIEFNALYQLNPRWAANVGNDTYQALLQKENLTGEEFEQIKVLNSLRNEFCYFLIVITGLHDSSTSYSIQLFDENYTQIKEDSIQLNY